MYFGQAIKFWGDYTCGIKLFVFVSGKASCLFDVFEKGDEFIFEMGGGILG